MLLFLNKKVFELQKLKAAIPKNPRRYGYPNHLDLFCKAQRKTKGFWIVDIQDT